jgi:Rhodopirellula transposase DDE domain
MNYSLQGNRKTEEGDDHPDRDAQFHHINDQVRPALAARRPVISVGTKKKELVGNYQNAGRQRREAKSPQTVNGHDFPTRRCLGRIRTGSSTVTEHGIRQRRDGPRYGRLCGRLDPGLVALRGTPPLSASPSRAHHGGRGLQQRLSPPPVEDGTPAPRRRERTWRSRCAASLRGRANGTRSNIASSRSSPRTGGQSRFGITKRSCA